MLRQLLISQTTRNAATHSATHATLDQLFTSTLRQEISQPTPLSHNNAQKSPIAPRDLAHAHGRFNRPRALRWRRALSLATPKRTHSHPRSKAPAITRRTPQSLADASRHANASPRPAVYSASHHGPSGTPTRACTPRPSALTLGCLRLAPPSPWQ